MNDTDALLAQLRDVHTPPVSMLPAPGWWILAIFILLLSALLYILYRRYQRNGWQREAFSELARLRTSLGSVPPSKTLSSASTLVRRVALVARPRFDVASVHGEPWLDLLDDICGKPLFKDGFGRLLVSGPYQADPSIGDDDLNALLDVVAELIKSAGHNGSSRAML